MSQMPAGQAAPARSRENTHFPTPGAFSSAKSFLPVSGVTAFSPETGGPSTRRARSPGARSTAFFCKWKEKGELERELYRDSSVCVWTVENTTGFIAGGFGYVIFNILVLRGGPGRTLSVRGLCPLQ